MHLEVSPLIGVVIVNYIKTAWGEFSCETSSEVLFVSCKSAIEVFYSQSPIAAALITEKDDDGFSPVHYAAKSGDLKVRCSHALAS